jgi:epoxyqueuosine reductase
LNSTELKEFINREARELGFSKVGFAKAEFVGNSVEDLFDKWISDGHHGEMKYMEGNREKRLDPSLLVDGTKTIIVFAANYYNTLNAEDKDINVCQYAQGDDYHDILKGKLKTLLEKLQKINPEIKGRFFSDSAPILERYWAEKAGIGWQGKNSLIITRELGSYVFLSELLLNVELEADEPHKNFCGKCTACLDGCPTNAFKSPGVLDSNKCISYTTIEYRGEFTEEQSESIGTNIYGCDICQEVCPWNNFSKDTTINEFKPRERNLNQSIEIWENMNQEEFSSRFKKSAVKRTKFSGLSRNINAVRDNLQRLKNKSIEK